MLLLGVLGLAACAGKIKPTQFTNPKFDFSFLERVAVLPFDNHSTGDRQADMRAMRLMITELLASGAVDVVEPGEVEAALAALPRRIGRGRDQPLGSGDIVALGKTLGVQGVIVGSVTQSETFRQGAVSIPVVTLDVHLVETETGATVWAATHTEKGGSVGARVLGIGGQPISQTTRECVRELLRTLIE